MKIFRNYIFFFLISFFFLAGCAPKKLSPTPPRLITAVQVTRKEGGITRQYYFTQPEQIDAMVHYLSSVHPYGIADRDPERVAGMAYRIELHLSDGSIRTFFQRANRYFSKDFNTWRLINPEKAAGLEALLPDTPSA